MPTRDIDALYALRILGDLFNEIGCGGCSYSAHQITQRQEVLLHCIAAIHASTDVQVPRTRGGNVVELRPTG